ncbi:MAG: aminotransferase class IV [Pseudomonadota bacterium]
MSLGRWAYLKDGYVRASEAAVSPFDRGFLFAHAAYEVTAVYGGRLLDPDGHFARLERTLSGIELPALAGRGELLEIHDVLIDRNGLDEGLVYLQITGGDYGGRDFAGPETLAPTLFLFTMEKPLIGASARDGVRAVSVEDTRWSRRAMKTTQLLSQALAYRAARAAGCETAWMHEDGVVTEAASANAWIVTREGVLVTRELSSSILAGITRDRVKQLVERAGGRIEERAFTLDEAFGAAEAFTTSAGALINPTIEIDAMRIGNGRPGPVTRRVQRLYYEAMGADIACVAPWARD